jgi:Protein of unknown function (DUF2815)
MAQNTQTYQMTKPAQIVWVSVVTPRPAGPKNQERYQAAFLLTKDHPDFAPMATMMANVVKAKFGSTDNREFPLQKGDKVADEAAEKGRDREWARGKEILEAHTNTHKRTVNGVQGEPLNPPRLVVLQNQKYVRYQDEERALAKSAFYSGVLAIGTFGFKEYEGFGGGVTCYLNEILSLGVGDRINTRVDDETKYGAPTQYIGKVSSTDPTAGAEISY